MTPPTPATKTSGRGWAYTGLLIGGLGSIAANIAHSFIPPTGAPADWSPEPGAVISAMIWPVFLFIAIEILARTPWPIGLSWNLLRWVGLPPVALVAAFVSYRHLSGLLDHYAEETLVVWFGPLAVDGVMLLGTSSLLATGKRHRPVTPVSAPTPATVAPAPSPFDTAPATVRPAAAPHDTGHHTNHRDDDRRVAEANPAKTTTPVTAVRPTPTAESPTPPPVAEPAPAPVPVPVRTPAPPAVVDLLPGARIFARAHHDAHGERINANQLAVRLQVPTPIAKDVLGVLYPEPTTNTGPHNGTPIGATK
jgi:hypothetical protein